MTSGEIWNIAGYDQLDELSTPTVDFRLEPRIWVYLIIRVSSFLNIPIIQYGVYSRARS